ncbi:hypothetical protein SAMN05192539_1004163 [Paraburkholderia diazotrophica]|uniref:Uncharacterized protein n=2 Tax=Paraburkholderia diazotrophica TaxID=667676 RepID=A0A1H6TK73_9BURK|nr:hypothetical protein SAMN05192539_1004163 [Paraburkholderia diazotrophica]
MTIEYYEMDLMPGRKFFRCEPLRASITAEECDRRWRAGNMLLSQAAGARKSFVDGFDADASSDASMRCVTCRGCPIGARHAGVQDANPSQLKGTTVCSRCHQGCTRLIGKHLCISCYNRQREQLVGKNRKGTAPVKLEPLRRRSISYLAAGQLHTKTVEHSLDMNELIVAVLRDETHAMKFVPTLPAKFLALRALDGARLSTDKLGD